MKNGITDEADLPDEIYEELLLAISLWESILREIYAHFETRGTNIEVIFNSFMYASTRFMSEGWKTEEELIKVQEVINRIFDELREEIKRKQGKFE